MESMRKRKGAKSSPPSAAAAGRKRVLCGDDPVRQSRKKKCTGEAKPGREETGSCSGGSGCAAAAVMTAPPCGPSSCGEPGRGLKRKLGCVESATRVGRKKKLEGEYVLGREIGQGKFGSVRLCRSRTTKVEYACKKLLKNGEETVHKEVEIMQHLSGHPGVVTLREVFEDSDCFYLVMELCSGGRLLDKISEEGRFSEHKAANMLKELVSVIKYCHEMGVIHRDIKPENILLTTSGKMKLADFGLAARVANGQKLAGVAGTPAYVAPEVLSGNYSEKADIWSTGVLLHLLLVGVLPFQGPSREAVFEAVKSVDLDFRGGIWESVSELARSLLGQMLTRDISSRMTADEVLAHPWILFYTECSSKVISTKNPPGSRTASFEEAEIIPSMQLKRVRSAFESFANYSNLSSEGSNRKSEDSGDGHFVDVLAAAISRVTISEPKRSRLCLTGTPIKQEHSSNMKANLLAAF